MSEPDEDQPIDTPRSEVPGLSAAAQQGLDLANRSIREMALVAAKACPGLKLHPTRPGHCICDQRLNEHVQAFCDAEQRVEDAVQSGKHASKGGARRAMGIPVPPVTGLKPSWADKIEVGLMGASPALPNAAIIVRDPRRITWWRRAIARITRRKPRTYQDYLDAGFVPMGALREGD